MEGTIRQWAGANLQCVLTEWASLSKTRGLGLELLCPYTVSSRRCQGPDWLAAYSPTRERAKNLMFSCHCGRPSWVRAGL